jgi:tetratricopeptide (TPR) repeat protein
MKTDDQFQAYFQQVQHLAHRAKTDSAAYNLLMQIIEDEITSSTNENPYEEFFKGELAFYSEKYQDALKHYLQSKSIPHYKLFCFRASAYLAKEAGNISKAKDFIEKALNVFPEDVPTKHLLHELNPNSSAFFQKPEIDPNAEGTMFSPSKSFTSNEDQSTPSTQNLIKRLYDNSTNTTYDKSTSSIPHVTKLPTGIKLPVHIPNRLRPHANATTSEVLTHSIAVFHQKQEQLIGDYMDMLESRPEPSENSLYVLQGWKESAQKTSLMHLLTQDAYRTAGGFFIRWNGKGIAVNPGKHFLELFHRQGLHIRDINYVIVTNEDPNTYAETEDIYNLNYQLNQSRSGLQVIHYYLNTKAHENLAQKLKPNFKQERNMIHCLEIFLDSPEIEKIVLNEDIILAYFPSSKTHSNLTISLELRSRNRETGDLQSISVGYVSNAPWSAYLSQNLGHCDLLIAGFGHTNLDDYSKNTYNEDCLGYNGTYSLMESVQPLLLLCSDFDGREGDIRLEVVKLLRQQYLEAHPHSEQTPVVLPADSKLVLDLMNLHVQCSVTNVKVHPLNISVIKTTEGGGHLQYLSPHCYT